MPRDGVLDFLINKRTAYGRRYSFRLWCWCGGHLMASLEFESASRGRWAIEGPMLRPSGRECYASLRAAWRAAHRHLRVAHKEVCIRCHELNRAPGIDPDFDDFNSTVLWRDTPNAE